MFWEDWKTRRKTIEDLPTQPHYAILAPSSEPTGPSMAAPTLAPMTAPTIGLAEAARISGVSESTIRRKRAELLELGAWRPVRRSLNGRQVTTELSPELSGLVVSRMPCPVNCRG